MRYERYIQILMDKDIGYFDWYSFKVLNHIAKETLLKHKKYCSLDKILDSDITTPGEIKDILNRLELANLIKRKKNKYRVVV